MHNIVIFNGSARKGQFTEHVTKLMADVISKNPELTATAVDPRKLNITITDEAAGANFPELTEIMQKADAYIIVAPEYNHGYPGSLKYILDLNLKQYIHKPVAFVGVSAGPFGGARVIENLVPVVRELGMVATFNDVNISQVQNEFNEDHTLKEPEKWAKRVERMLSELVWMTQTLKHGRETFPSEHHE